MVTGSGLQNRDEEIFEHKPFAVIADALAKQGIATLRYDDRGFGESKGDLVNVTTEDLKNDALAGVELLRKQFKKVGVLGHSEGGTIGLILAAEGKVDFVVSLAGGVISFEETLLDQNRWTLQQAGYSKDVTDRYCTVLKGLFDELKVGRNPAPANHNLPAELEQNLKMAQAQSSTPYMRYFLGLDLTGSLGKITCPVLALNGTKDRQVNCEENLNALRGGLAGQKEIKAMDGLNHMFQHCGTGDPSEYKDIEETFAPEALDIITTWLKKFK
jgi:pimeloyl-ACP methyl ester carboxylesterase